MSDRVIMLLCVSFAAGVIVGFLLGVLLCG